ncbi:hypothetical protein JCGZ_12554 [Jatropha curcas]|uniref:Uncharacterized protein n=1 Tax=Jatropha curcas TaxID=180498 RepID=A0A067KAP8_JATCU|nr:uncharacterized protein LOC105639865 [Jatropha curcas]KDP32093.1 hypothetical protein JCGZ_12554 [Jatropha curcas]
MRREEKRRKFHEALLNTLYPPAPQPQEKDEEKLSNASKKDFDVNLIPDDYGLQESKSSTSDDDGESECGQQKLTRAQRKRLRRKKLKEDVPRRKQIIGPLLPPLSGEGGSVCGGGDAAEECTPGDRQNDYDTQGSSSKQRKLKQRRMAKRLARESLKLSGVENCVQNQNLEASNIEICEKDNQPCIDN